MGREPDAYRDNYAAIREMFPDKFMFSISEVCTLTGMCYNTVKKRFTFINRYISIGDLARQMSYTEAKANRRIIV